MSQHVNPGGKFPDLSHNHMASRKHNGR
jgi:hypothetical protein